MDMTWLIFVIFCSCFKYRQSLQTDVIIAWFAQFKHDLKTEDQNKPGDLKDDVASLKQDVAQDISYGIFRFDATKLHLLAQMKSFTCFLLFIWKPSCLVDYDDLVFIYVAWSLIFSDTGIV